MVAITAAMATSIVGCSSQGGAATSSDAVKGATVSIVGPEAGDPYYQEVACGARTEGKKLGMTVGEQQAAQNQSQASQNTIVQNVLTKSPKALIYTPADPVAGGLPLRNAKQDGVTVIDVDAQLSDAGLYDSFIASDHYQGAQKITKTLVELIGGSGEIAAIGSLPSNPITQARIKGFQDELKNYPNVKVVNVSYPDLSPDAIQADAASLLIKYPELKGIYTTNFLNSTGAAVALRNANLVGKVKMVSWDTGAPNVKLLEEGSVQATVAQQPFTMGQLAIQQIAKKLAGGKPVKTVHAPVSILTSEQVDTPTGKKLWYSGTCSG
ncbi:substrate-binding domain-containing protein [Leifsonia sp. EB41]|uniref:substrate-binding domain-containing protein n=1 Tax=Leifsonia sp. EB41 TaxID=3156260 RepID=UPI00351191DC